MPFYAVAKGRTTGVYQTWDLAKVQVIGLKFAKYRKFDSLDDANAFVEEHSSTSSRSSSTAQKATVDDTAPKATVDIPSDALIVFTDGSSLCNGKKSAKAGYGVHWPNHPELSGSYKLQGNVQTNNRAEYSGCIHAIKQANEIDPSLKQTLVIYTDSMLMINSMTKWIGKWKRSGWKKSTGEDVLNKDLLQELDSLTSSRKVIWKHVPAHTGLQDWISVQNDIVDKLAKQGSCQGGLMHSFS